MISPTAFLDTPGAPPAGAGPNDSERINRMLDHAEFNGWYLDPRTGHHVPMWFLHKPVGKYPRGSTLCQTTLERALFGKDEGAQ